MTTYRYFIPIVSVAPHGDFTMTFTVPLARIREVIVGKLDALQVEQSLVHGGNVVDRKTTIVPLDGKNATAPVAYFVKDGFDESGWRTGEDVAYLETHIAAVGEGGFSTHFCPPTYTIYSGENRKSLLSDNNLKFGDHNVITQNRQFGRWIAGYPLVEVDPARDVEESFVVINPFGRPAVTKIEAPSLKRSFPVRVPARRGLRVALGPNLNIDRRWRGQIFVSGPNRLIVFDCKHSRVEPSDVTTLEHTDLFRGDLSTIPITREARKSVGKILKRVGFR
jgi:hypothetical protein